MNFYEVRYAPGSSYEKVKEQLEAGRCCSCVTVGFDIFIHHCRSHEELRLILGVDWADTFFGNFDCRTINGVKSLIVRWKGVDYRIQPAVNSAIRVHFGFEVGDLTIPPPIEPLSPEEIPF